MQQTLREEEYMDKYAGIVKSTLKYGAALTSVPVMSACMVLWKRVLFTHPNISIMHKIPVLHLKSDFITLVSREGLAALRLC